jgi:hypothetical protein
MSEAVKHLRAAISLMHLGDDSVVIDADVRMESRVVVLPFCQPPDGLIYWAGRVKLANLIIEPSFSSILSFREHNNDVVIVCERNTRPCADSGYRKATFIEVLALAPGHRSIVKASDVVPQAVVEKALTLVTSTITPEELMETDV